MKLGQLGEEHAKSYLIQKGYKILETNYRCKLGEIDIIACQEKTLIFIEVKTRRSLEYGLPCEAVTREKLRHIINVARIYTVNNSLCDIDQRIDVIELLIRDEKTYMRHLENVG